MAETLLEKHRNAIASLELIPGTGGVFEVTVDDKLIFSKKELNRFPEDGEVENKIS